MENSSATQSQQSGQVEKTINLTLTKTQGSCTDQLYHPVCQFSYHWNFDKNVGEAGLDSIDQTPTNIVLHPLGLAGELAFMSDIPPTTFNIGGKEIVVYRVILDLTLELNASAAIMYGNGSCIETTDNWVDTDSFKK